jgi:hypothetical protein
MAASASFACADAARGDNPTKLTHTATRAKAVARNSIHSSERVRGCIEFGERVKVCYSARVDRDYAINPAARA